jgi:hypothetical protein
MKNNEENILTGVLSANNLNWEFVDNEICLECDPYFHYLDKDICPDCKIENSLEWQDEENSDVKICHECGGEFDFEMECSDHSKLIGDWTIITDKNGEIFYEPTEDGEFSAIVTSSSFNCVQVVKSKYIREVRCLCSPCFPGQADLNSGSGNIKCYDLPDYLVEY